MLIYVLANPNIQQIIFVILEFDGEFDGEIMNENKTLRKILEMFLFLSIPLKCTSQFQHIDIPVSYINSIPS